MSLPLEHMKQKLEFILVIVFLPFGFSVCFGQRIFPLGKKVQPVINIRNNLYLAKAI